MSALRSSAGPAVWIIGTASSAAMMWASEVLPRPGGPASSTWSSGSPRRRARLDEDPELLGDLDLIDEVGQLGGRSERSKSSSAPRGRASWITTSPPSSSGPIPESDPPCRVRRSCRLRPRRPAERRLDDLLLRSRPWRPPGASRPRVACSPGSGRPSRAIDRGSSSPVGTGASSASASISPATFSRSSTMIRSAVRLPIPGAAWNRFASPAAIARSSSRTGPPERTAIATFGPTPPTEIR